jgi:Fe-Mn family superoxide dismutase
MKFALPGLPYNLDALEPYISRETIEFHHTKHMMSYVTNLNSLVSETKYKKTDLETIIKFADGAIYNNAAQVWNHSFYFESMRPGNSNDLQGAFLYIINSNFGSVSFFKNSFTKAAVSLFGSGWVWLIINQKYSLEIIQENNAGNPIRRGLIPLLVCDVWEHAYYLDYKNRRSDYVEAFWNLVNWTEVEKRYNSAVQLNPVSG